MDIIPYIHVTDFVRLMRTADFVYNGQNVTVHLNLLYASSTVAVNSSATIERKRFVITRLKLFCVIKSLLFTQGSQNM